MIFVINAIKEVKDINLNITDISSSYCKIYDNNNKLITNEKVLLSSYTPIENINPVTIDAFISIEDKNFYKHDGLNYKRILKSTINNIKSKSLKEGASTITQQLIKNKFLSNEKTIKRKVKEAYLAKKLEGLNSKDEIMECYLNTIYFGNGAYGIGEASFRFFNKTPMELNLDESCVLAGLVKSPNTYSPINDIELSKKRRNVVIYEMYEDGKISFEDFNRLKNNEIKLNIQNLYKINNLDLYSKFVLNEASEILNLTENEILSKDYKIYTYQDSDIQSVLDKIISDDKYYQKNSYGNIADSLSIILDNKTAGVTAVSGKSQYDLVNFKRQPGSLIKPILVYTPALERKLIYPCSKIKDEKNNFEDYSPRNVGDKYYGNVTIREAVEKSLNIPAVDICNQLGIDYVKDYVKNCGLNISDNDNGLAIALGGLTNGFTLQNITNSYIPLINNGKYIKSMFIKKITSPQNLTIYNNLLTEIQYCKPESAYLMTNILSSNINRSTSKKLSNFNFDLACKTGTVNVKDTNYNTDAYSLAYTSEHTMATWLGNYSMNKEYNLEGNNNGGTFATEIIKDTFLEIYNENKPEKFNIPDNIVKVPIDALSLELDNEVRLAYDIPDKYVIYEVFDKNNIPTINSNRFTVLPEIKLNYELSKNSCTLSFDSEDFIKYDLYKISRNGNKKLLKSISNFSGKYEFIDSNLDYNVEYEYYLEYYFSNNSNKKLSNSVIVKIEKDYNKLLNNNLTWLFA